MTRPPGELLVTSSSGTWWRRVLVPSAIVLIIPPLAAQQQAPVFRAGVEIVQLDVSVLDRNRHPVRGLAQGDFTILENGKPRKIVAFTAFDIDEAPPPAVGWMRDVPPDVTSNEHKDGRLFVMVMDDALIPQDPKFIRDSKRIAASIIEKLGPEDLTAIVFTGDNRKTQDFTNDKTKLVVDHYFYQSAIRTLGNVAEYLIAVPNRRKAVFWVSPGVPMDMIDCRPVDIRDPYIVLPEEPVKCEPTGQPPPHVVALQQRTDEVFRRAQRANVTIYPIDPTGLGGLQAYVAARLGPFNELVAMHKATMSRDFLSTAAANTGGRVVMNINEFEPGITDIFAENNSYYFIGFEPASTAADGKLRRIEVKVNRPDVDVRTRSGYYAPEPVKPADKAKPAASAEAVALGKAIGGLLADSSLPMKVALAPLAVPGQRLATVTVVLGVRQPIPASAAKGQITETTELQISAFTPEGDPRGTQRHTARVLLRAGSDGEAAYEALGRIDLPAGRYRLRLAAHNATSSKTGSVFADVAVPDYSNMPFSAAPVMIGAAPGRVSGPKGLFSPLLPFVPTADREFLARDTATALLRLYQSGQKPIERVQVTITIRDSRNAIEVTATESVGVDRFTALGQQLASAAADAPPRARTGVVVAPVLTQDKFANLALRAADVRHTIPLARLPPGEHLLTFEATLGTTVLRRDVRFNVKRPR